MHAPGTRLLAAPRRPAAEALDVEARVEPEGLVLEGDAHLIAQAGWDRDAVQDADLPTHIRAKRPDRARPGGRPLVGLELRRPRRRLSRG